MKAKRFEWKGGDNHPIKDEGTMVLWDNQENKPVITTHREYGGLHDLEFENDKPFTTLEEWVNEISNLDLLSVDIVDTDNGAVFSSSGFEESDENAWQKDDPRGAEYGMFQAGYVDEEKSLEIYVLYTPKKSGRKQYRMTFADKESFLSWASDHT